MSRFLLEKLGLVVSCLLILDFCLSDATGQTPKYHIPARFVTLIPKEFPAAQTNPNKRKSATAFAPPPYGAAQKAAGASNPAKRRSLLGDVGGGTGDALDDMLTEIGDFTAQSGPLDNFDQLDLDFAA